MSGVTLSSRLHLPDPYQDWKDRRSLLWSIDNEPSSDHILASKIRQEVISENFNPLNPITYSLGPIEHLQRKPASLSHVFKATMEETYKLGILHTARNIIEITAIVALGILAVSVPPYLAFSIGRGLIKASAQKLKAGNYYWYKSDDFMRSFPIRPYDASDHRSAIYSSIFASLLMGFGSFMIISYLTVIPFIAHDNKKSILNIFLRLKELNTKKYALVQHLEKQPSSLSNTELSSLCNTSEEGGYLDPISKKLIPSSSVTLPFMIKIGDFAFRIQTLLPAIFIHDLEGSKIHHPTEDRSMQSDEQAKFLEDLSRLFSVSKENILDCWKIDDEELPDVIPDSLQDNVTDIFFLRRMKKFLDLIPSEVIDNHLASTETYYSMSIYMEYPSWISSLS